MFVSFGKPSAGDKRRRAAQSTAVQEWAAQYLQEGDEGRFGDDPTLAVSEVKCLEVGCPPMETVVLLLDEKDPLVNKVKIQMGLMDVTQDDVELAVGRFLRGEQAECNCGEVMLREMMKGMNKFPAGSAADEGKEGAAVLELLKQKLKRKPEATTRDDIGKLMASERQW